MLTTLADQIEEVRRRIDEPTASKISNNYIIRSLNDGAVKLCRELYITTDDVTAFHSNTAQQGYPLPLDFIDSSDVIWQYDVAHYPLARLDRKSLLQSLPQQGDPAYYAIDPARKLILFDPIPQTSAQITTLSPGIGATNTTITVLSTVGFGGIGYLTIDNEIIQYTGTTPTTFTGCVRGACNTVAASHSNLAAVTWNDIVLYYTRLPKIIKNVLSGQVTVVNGSTTVTNTSTTLWYSGQNVYAGQYLGIGNFSTTSVNENFPMTWYKIASVDGTTQITLAAAYQEVGATATSCIITDMSELFEQDNALQVAWATYQCEMILNNKEKAAAAQGIYNYEMIQAKERLNGPDNLLVTKATRFANNVAGQIVRAPSHYEKFNF